jgi:NAD(P)-dependent dehydrogenase (short-subunit alcohol dehydrogenase family)
MQTPKDRIALVTGANKGIGFEIARQLGQEGHHILIGARDRGRGQSAVAELGSKGFAARFVQIDLTKLDTIVGAAADIEDAGGTAGYPDQQRGYTPMRMRDKSYADNSSLITASRVLQSPPAWA